MVRWRVLLAAVILALLLSPPVLAQGGEGGRVTFGQDITVRSGENINGDLVAFGGSVTIDPDGQVRGNVVSFGGNIDIGGRVDGDVISFGGSLVLRSGAYVAGNALATNGVSRSPGAVVRGQVGDMRGGMTVPALPSAPAQPRLWWPGWGPGWPWGSGAFDLLSSIWRSIIGTLTMLALGIIIVLLIPRATHTMGHAFVAFAGQSLATGLLTWLVAALAVPLLIIICIGIPVAVLGVAALAIATGLGWIVAGLVLGERLLDALNHADHQPVLAVVVGLLVLAVLSAVPCLGILVTILVATWGLGAVILTRCGTTPYAPTAGGPLPPLVPTASPAPHAPPMEAPPAAPEPAEPPAPSEPHQNS